MIGEMLALRIERALHPIVQMTWREPLHTIEARNGCNTSQPAVLRCLPSR